MTATIALFQAAVLIYCLWFALRVIWVSVVDYTAARVRLADATKRYWVILEPGFVAVLP